MGDHGVEGVEPLDGLGRIPVRELVHEAVIAVHDAMVPRPTRVRTVGESVVSARVGCHAGPMAAPAPLRVFTDGACSGNPGPGGWAWASSPTHFGSGGEPDTTNNRMELTAVLRALEANPGPLVVVMDSTYVKDGLESWHKGWERNGWKTKAGQPVKNREIWEPLVALAKARAHEVRFEWVKGHSGDAMNDLVDLLAVEQRDLHRAGGATGAPAGSGAVGVGPRLADLSAGGAAGGAPPSRRPDPVRGLPRGGARAAPARAGRRGAPIAPVSASPRSSTPRPPCHPSWS